MRPKRRTTNSLAPRFSQRHVQIVRSVSAGLLGLAVILIIRDADGIAQMLTNEGPMYEQVLFSSGTGFRADTMIVGEHKEIKLMTQENAQRFNVVLDRLQYDDVQIRLYDEDRELATELLVEKTVPWQKFIIEHNHLADGTYYLVIELDNESEVIEPIFLK
ncbi:MAG: hypothetical protein AAF388_22185 [Bacteroidota bacterium]